MNKKQKEWLSEFFKRHPDYKLSKPIGITKLGAGDISITLERTEWIYIGAVPTDYSGGYLPGFKYHYIKTKLSKIGELLSDVTYNCKILSYPHCPLAPDVINKYDLERLKIKGDSQLNFPFTQVVLTVNQPPLLKGSFYRVKRRSRRKKGQESVTKCRLKKIFPTGTTFLETESSASRY